MEAKIQFSVLIPEIKRQELYASTKRSQKHVKFPELTNKIGVGSSKSKKASIWDKQQAWEELGTKIVNVQLGSI